MNSSLFNEWVEEERKEAVEKASKEVTKEVTKKNIIELLIEKYDFVSKDIRDSIESIDDVVVLNELLKRIIKLENIEDFKELLEKAKKI